jgi:hypothetical protein
MLFATATKSLAGWRSMLQCDAEKPKPSQKGIYTVLFIRVFDRGGEFFKLSCQHGVGNETRI